MSESLLPMDVKGVVSAATPSCDFLVRPQASTRLAQRDGYQALVYGRIRLESDGLGVAGQGAGEVDRILQRWIERGEAVLQELCGEYLVALWDPRRRCAIVAVDRFSTYPMFWGSVSGRVAFGTAPAEVDSLLSRASQPHWQAVVAYAYFHMIPAPLSILAGVQRLDLGEALRVDIDGASVFRYWSPVFEEHHAFDFPVERERFLGCLRDGVAECTAGLSRAQVGCFLSGGTDSSTIAGLVTRQYEGPARTFSIGFDVGGYDETSYSRLAAKHFGTEHTEYFLSPDDVLAGVDVVATQYEQPFGNSSAVPTFFCARIAKEAGIARMLGGDGGDELYGGNERYAKQAVFAMYERVPAWLRSGVLEPSVFGAMRRIDAGPFAKARSYIEQAREPLPDRLQSRYNLLNRLGAREVFTNAVLGEVMLEQPLALEREVWARAQASSMPMTQINRLLAWDFKFTLADSDLPKVTRMCQAAGVEVAFPMITHALVEHSLRLRPGEKLKGRQLRHFFKESLRGFLPDEIIAKKKHGFGMPFGDWLLTHERLRATADDALRSLAARGVIREPFLDRLLVHLASGHAGYYGTMVWVLMILELWLRASPLPDLRVGRS